MGDLIIELKDVSRIYNLNTETVHALRKVNFKVKHGEYLAITGPSGSGKSSLANTIGGLDTPTSGSVMVDGRNLARMKDDNLSDYRNEYIGFVFQSFNLQPGNTALQNVIMPLLFEGVKPEERRQRAIASLQAVGLGNYLDRRASELSSGQQQLVAIARALVTNPKILIADEPTGNLDSARGMQIYEVLRSINKTGTTVLVITHDPNMAHLADRIVQMGDGKLTEVVT
jgi:putative ABC transport system ATP-binding protein